MEDQYRRVVDQCLGETEPLFHTERESVDEVVALVGQVQKLQHVANHLLSLRTRDLVGHGEEIEEFPDLHTIVDAEIVAHVTYATADVEGTPRDAVAPDDAFAMSDLCH